VHVAGAGPERACLRSGAARASRGAGPDRAERTYLFALAGSEHDRPIDQEVPQGLAGVVAALAPHPAYITNALLDVLAINDAALELFASPDGSAGSPTNLARWGLQPACRSQGARGLGTGRP